MSSQKQAILAKLKNTFLSDLLSDRNNTPVRIFISTSMPFDEDATTRRGLQICLSQAVLVIADISLLTRSSCSKSRYSSPIVSSLPHSTEWSDLAYLPYSMKYLKLAKSLGGKTALSSKFYSHWSQDMKRHMHTVKNRQIELRSSTPFMWHIERHHKTKFVRESGMWHFQQRECIQFSNYICLICQVLSLTDIICQALPAELYINDCWSNAWHVFVQQESLPRFGFAVRVANFAH